MRRVLELENCSCDARNIRVRHPPRYGASERARRSARALAGKGSKRNGRWWVHARVIRIVIAEGEPPVPSALTPVHPPKKDEAPPLIRNGHVAGTAQIIDGSYASVPPSPSDSMHGCHSASSAWASQNHLLHVAQCRPVQPRGLNQSDMFPVTCTEKEYFSSRTESTRKK